MSSSLMVQVLLSGVYLGGVLVAWLELCLRHQRITAVGWAGILAWPVALVVLLAMGAEKCRDAIGLTTHEEHEAFMAHQREHMRQWDANMVARERAADEVARNASDAMSALHEGVGAIERSTYWIAMMHASSAVEARFRTYEDDLLNDDCADCEDDDCDCDVVVDLDHLKELLANDFSSLAEQRYPKRESEAYVAKHTAVEAGLESTVATSSVVIGVHDGGCRDLGCAGCVDVSAEAGAHAAETNPHLGSKLDVAHLAETGEVREPLVAEESRVDAIPGAGSVRDNVTQRD